MENPNTEDTNMEDPTLAIDSPEDNNSGPTIVSNNRKKWPQIIHSLLLCISFCYVASWGMISYALFIIGSFIDSPPVDEANRNSSLLWAVISFGIPIIIYFLCFLIYLRKPKIEELEKFEKILLNMGAIIASIAIAIIFGFILFVGFWGIAIVMAFSKNSLIVVLIKIIGLFVGIFLPGILFYTSAALTFYSRPNTNSNQLTSKKKLFTRIHLACLMLIFMGFILAVIIPPQIKNKSTKYSIKTEKLDDDKESLLKGLTT